MASSDPASHQGDRKRQNAKESRPPLYQGMREFHVLNLGAGVQSTALYLLGREGRFQFDVAIFADTQEEPADVYRHLDWLRSLNDPPIWIRTAGKLGDDLKHGRNSMGQRFVSIPCFTNTHHEARQPREREGIMRRQCTSEYKIEVCIKAIRRELVGLDYRQHMPKDIIVHQYFGITTDEIERTKRSLPQKWSLPVYPFIEMGWSRQDCIAYLKDRVPHTVPRSACTFCPYKSNEEWQRLKDTDQAGWDRAVQIDAALRTEGPPARRMDKSMYVHRSCLPLPMVDLTGSKDAGGLVNECLGMCGV